MAKFYVGGPEGTARGLLNKCLQRPGDSASPASLGAAAGLLAKKLQLHWLPCGFEGYPPDGLKTLNDFSIFDKTAVAEQEDVLFHAVHDPAGARAVGALVGMAVADSVGHMFEFIDVGEPGHFFDHKTLMVTGFYNRFRLQAGQWTDDTSMGLCVADSLLANEGYNGSDMRSRFWNWWSRGYNNAFRLDKSRSNSVGLGGNIGRSLDMGRRPKPRYGSIGSSEDAGNGSLMRLAPLPVFLHRDAHLAAQLSAESSLTTHPGPIAANACSFLGLVIARAITRPAESSQNIKSFLDECVAEFQAKADLHEKSEMARLLRSDERPGSKERCWNWRDPAGPFLEETLASRGRVYNGYPVSPDYFGSYSMDGLAVALHSVYHTHSFMEAIARCINFLGDSDSHGSICGQIAGAFYGIKAIDERLISALDTWDEGQIALRGALLYALGAGLSEEKLDELALVTAEADATFPLKRQRKGTPTQEKEPRKFAKQADPSGSEAHSEDTSCPAKRPLIHL